MHFIQILLATVLVMLRTSLATFTAQSVKYVCPSVTVQDTEAAVEAALRGSNPESHTFLRDVTTVAHPFWMADLDQILLLHHNLSALSQDITLVTHTSINRLSALSLQCKAWPGTVAAAIYLPLVNGSVHMSAASRRLLLGSSTTVEGTVQRLQRLHVQLVSSGCRLNLALFTEELKNASSFLSSVPVNAMRNKALELAQSEAVLLLDGDFVPGPATALERLLFRPTAHADLLQGLHSQHALLVLPAFEPMRTCGSLDQQLQLAIHVVDTDSKHPLVAAYHNGSIDVFQSLYHHASDYRRWLGAEDVYEIRYVSEHPEGLQPNNYEPYILALKKHLPWYDERFRGYHYNKQGYIYKLYRLGMRFMVHPEAFVVHVPHPGDMQKEELQTEMHVKVLHLYYTTIPYQIKDGSYAPYVARKAACQ